MASEDLECTENRIQLQQIGDGLLRHAEAAMRNALEESFGRESTECLAYRRSTHTGGVADLLFANELAGCDLARKEFDRAELYRPDR